MLFNWRQSEQSALLPVYAHRLIAEHVRALQGVSGGELIECYEHVPGRDYGYHAEAVAHLALYTYSRAWWDVTQDTDAMLDEYYRLFYGPARAGVEEVTVVAPTGTEHFHDRFKFGRLVVE